MADPPQAHASLPCSPLHDHPPDPPNPPPFPPDKPSNPSPSHDLPLDHIPHIPHTAIPFSDDESQRPDHAFAPKGDLKPSVLADHLKDYDPAEPLGLEDLMDKDELVPVEEVTEGVEAGVLEFMKRPPEEDDGTLEEQMEFVRELEHFFIERKMEYKHPKFYGENLNCLKLWRTVVRLGGYESVTAGKLWRQVGETFNPPKKCTTVSWSFRGFYEKALLDYERYRLHRICPNAAQGAAQYDPSIQGAEGPSSSVHPSTSQPCASYMTSLGRARRDAASRAMQGWHSQRFLGNGEVGDPIIKDKSSIPAAKRGKQLKMGLLKRKKASTLERAVQAARIKGGRTQYLDGTIIKDENSEDFGNPSYTTMHKKKGIKQEHAKQFLKNSHCSPFNGSDIWVADEGPPADWVKINVHKTRDCFEVYALVPGLLREELRIQCEPGGQLVITGEPEQPNNAWGVTSFKKVINLPLPIDANQTSAVVTLHGQLFVRVPYGQTHT